jgi:hypothetical protein
MSTAFHPQTDGESERVNQELELYLRTCGNFRQDDWAKLLSIIEFAHNARPHRSTHRSPFEIWYGFQPIFKPPLYLQTRVQSVDERVQYLEQIRKEVTAALLIAAREMRNSGPPSLTHTFQTNDQVLLEATNLQTTHPKAKLAPRRYGPFKVLWASPTNCKLELPPHMKIHPVFHNSLLKPYHKTKEHGPNYEKPAPEIINDEEGHYEIEEILKARPTRNRKSTQYLIKWKGYPASENSWLPEKELTNARELLDQFKWKHSSRQRRNMLVLQAQQRPKEGILSRTQSATSSITSSKSKVTQVNPVTRSARDPEKQGAHAKPSGDLVSRDQIPDISRVLSRDKSRDATHFGWARSPLINQWQTMGTVHNQRRHVTPVIG